MLHCDQEVVWLGEKAAGKVVSTRDVELQLPVAAVAVQTCPENLIA